MVFEEELVHRGIPMLYVASYGEKDWLVLSGSMFVVVCGGIMWAVMRIEIFGVRRTKKNKIP